MLNVATAREYLKGVDELQLQMLLNAVCSEFEKETRRLWARRVDHQFHLRIDDVDCRTIFLPLLPVETLAVSVRGPGELTYTAVAAADYDVNTDRGQLTKLVGTWYGDVKCAITGGYTNADLQSKHPDIVYALITQMRFMNERFSKDNLIINSHSFEKQGTTFLRGDQHPLFARTCSQYRRHV
jgi:hypothetical protein